MMLPKEFSHLSIGYGDFYAAPDDENGENGAPEKVHRPKGKQTEADIAKFFSFFGGQSE